MNNAAQIHLHKFIVVLKKQDHSISLFQYVSLSAYYRSDLPVNKRHSRVDARIVPRDCGPTILGPSLR